jgi:hypothetical protein
MEHDKHKHEFEQELHETLRRVSAVYKNVQPDKKLLENVLAQLPELPAAAVSTDRILGAPSPYQRFLSMNGVAYLVPAAFVMVLVAVVSFRGAVNDPTRLAQESSVPETAPMAMIAEDAQPSLMMASEPAPEGDTVGARMMAPSAKSHGSFTDTRFECDGKVLLMRTSEPALIGSAGDLTLDTGETLSFVLSDGASDARRVYRNELGDEFTIQVDMLGNRTATLVRGGKTQYRDCRGKAVIQ